MVSPMPAQRYRTGALAMISVSMKMWLGGILEKEYSRRLPSGWYTMPRDVQAAHVEAMVGKVKKGRPMLWARTLQVSMALPPPTAKSMSASATWGRSISIFSTEASPPYQNTPMTSRPEPSMAFKILSLAAARAFSPPMMATFVP